MVAEVGILANAWLSYATHTMTIISYYGGTHGLTPLIICAVPFLYMLSH